MVIKRITRWVARHYCLALRCCSLVAVMLSQGGHFVNMGAIARLLFCLASLAYCVDATAQSTTEPVRSVNPEASRQRPTRDRSTLHEPVYRVTKTTNKVVGDSSLSARTARPNAPRGEDGGLPTAGDSHPLDPALAMARRSLEHMGREVKDYTATLVKRERIGNELGEHEFMLAKIRQARVENGRKIPFSVYLSFKKPDHVRGREVIYVEGRNGGRMTAHEGGFKGRFLPTVDLLPTSVLAMRGQRYPITEIGIETLTKRLIEKGERDRKNGICKVRLVDGAKVAKRTCTMLEVVHEHRKPQLEFHLARVFLDQKLNLPIRYEAYDWPATPNGEPQLLEEYTYMDVKVNVGLTDKDFDRSNSAYRF